MGYTISIKVEKKENIDFVMDFMEKMKLSSSFKMLFPCLEKSRSLSFCNKRNHVGFDYGANFITRELSYVLIHWLCHKVGDGKSYFYDGEEEPLSVERNNLGIRKFNKIEVDLYKGINFNKEIKRIDSEWALLLFEDMV